MAMSTQETENRVAELTAGLPEQIKNYTATDENYKSFLAMVSKLSSYSVNNMILIQNQRPDATICAGYKAWETNFDRHVNEGAKGIQIIAPMVNKKYVYEEKKDKDGNIIIGRDGKPLMNKIEKVQTNYKVTYIFDVSDTSGAPLPEVTSIIDADDRDYKKIFDDIAATSPVPVVMEEIKGSTNGYYSLAENTIHIADNLPDAMKVKTLIHEMAHYYLHNMNSGTDMNANRNEKEISAESVAYVVCKYYGLDTSEYSFGYISTWSRDKDISELRLKLDEIRKTSNVIINAIDYQAFKMHIAEKDELSFKSAAGYVQIKRCADGYSAEQYDGRMNFVNAAMIDAHEKSIDAAASEAIKIFHLNKNYMTRIDDAHLNKKIEKAQQAFKKNAKEKLEPLVADKFNYRHKI